MLEAASALVEASKKDFKPSVESLSCFQLGTEKAEGLYNDPALFENEEKPWQKL